MSRLEIGAEAQWSVCRRTTTQIPPLAADPAPAASRWGRCRLPCRATNCHVAVNAREGDPAASARRGARWRGRSQWTRSSRRRGRREAGAGIVGERSRKTRSRRPEVREEAVGHDLNAHLTARRPPPERGNHVPAVAGGVRADGELAVDVGCRTSRRRVCVLPGWRGRRGLAPADGASGSCSASGRPRWCRRSSGRRARRTGRAPSGRSGASGAAACRSADP